MAPATAGNREFAGNFVPTPSPPIVVDVPGEVEQQKRHDRGGPGRLPTEAPQQVLRARISAVLDAQRAVVDAEEGALWALRQSLVDLAAISELLVEGLPARTISDRANGRPVEPRGGR